MAVLARRQTHVTFNSILNRLVLFCARFSLPEYGYRFAELSFGYIGDGHRENEGSVLCSELGMLHAAAAPQVAIDLFQRANKTASGRPEQVGTELAIHVHECLHYGAGLDIERFDRIWSQCLHYRLAEPMARASLLRGSLLLREGNLKSALYWIERTATVVQLYHMKQFEIPILTDQILHALLVGNISRAHHLFEDLASEFGRVEKEAGLASALIGKVLRAAEKAAATLRAEPSAIERPDLPPRYCDPLAEIRQNIASIALLLGLAEKASLYQDALSERPCPEVSDHRCIEVMGRQLILGAY